MQRRLTGAFSLFCLAAAVLVGPWGRVEAAEEEFVGVLALAVDNAVADKLMLTDEQKKKLLEIIDERESKALTLAVELKDVSAGEREAKLGPFRKQSEAAGLAILTVEQRDLLEQARLQKVGPVALGEANVADTLELTGEQKAEIQKLLADRAAEWARSNDRNRRGIRSSFDRRLVGVLDELQRAEWFKLSGLPAPAAPQPGDAQVAQNPEPPASERPATATERPAASKPAPKGDGLLRFNFQFQPWPDVLDWFATQADLSLQADNPPGGTFNYKDNRAYTPAQAIDLLNSVLLTKGYTLVKRDRMLMLINLDDGIPPNLVSDVPLSELDSKGEFELISVLFQLDRMTPEEAEAEITRVKGPQGAILTFPKAGLIRVTETAGRLRMIRSILERIEHPEGKGAALRVFELKNQEVNDVLGVVRQLVDIPPDQYAAADGSIRLALDPSSGKLLVTGKPDKVAKVEEILKIVDVPGAATGSGVATAVDTPQLEVYSIAGADPTSVLQVT